MYRVSHFGNFRYVCTHNQPIMERNAFKLILLEEALNFIESLPQAYVSEVDVSYSGMMKLSTSFSMVMDSGPAGVRMARPSMVTGAWPVRSMSTRRVR